MDHPSWLVPSFHPISTESDFEPSRVDPHNVQITAHRHEEINCAQVGLTSWLRTEEGTINIANAYLADASWKTNPFFKHWNNLRVLAFAGAVRPGTVHELVFVYGIWQRALCYTYGFVRYLLLWKRHPPHHNFTLPYHPCMGAFVVDQHDLELLVRQRVHAILASEIPEDDCEFQKFTLKSACIVHLDDTGTVTAYGGGATASSFDISGTPLASHHHNFSSSAKLPWQFAMLPSWCRWYGLDCPRVDNSPLSIQYSFEKPEVSNREWD
jgi:hypothetical protein